MCLMWNNREGPQVREPSKCLNGQSYGERLAKEAFSGQLQEARKKDSDRAITPVAEAVRVPAHLAPPGSPQAKQLCHRHAQLSLGQSCHRQKKGLVSMRAGSLQSCLTLCNPVDRGLTSFSVREGGFPGRQWHPTPILLPGKSHGRRAWWAAVHGVAKSRI